MSLKFLKNDALVKIEIGSGFVQRLQKVLLYILENKSSEEIEKFKKLVEEKKELNESWMEPLLTLTVLLRDIEVAADQQNLSYESSEINGMNLPNSEED